MVITESLGLNESVGSATKLQNGAELHHRGKNGTALNGQHSPATVHYRKEITYALFETDTEKVEEVLDETVATPELAKEVEAKSATAATSPKKYKYQYVWKNIAAMVMLHVAAIYGAFMIPYAKLPTILWAYICLLYGTLGVQSGAHRLWAHKTYKANFGVRL